MRHAVEKYFRRERAAAIAKYHPPATTNYIERDIGLAAHIQRSMPLFLTLREHDGTPLATAMLPPGGVEAAGFRCLIVRTRQQRSLRHHDDAIQALAAHVQLGLTRERCYRIKATGV